MASLIPESSKRNLTMVFAEKKPVQAIESQQRWRQSLLWRVLHNTQMTVGLVCVGILALAAVAAPLIAQDPATIDLSNPLSPPSPTAPFGTDELGRDTFSRIVYGGRVSLQVAIIAVGIGLVVGMPLGLIAGYFGKMTDSVIMRIMDGLQAFPAVLLAIVIASVLGPGLNNAMVAIGIVSIPGFARIMRGQVLQIKEEDYVLAARALGSSDFHIIFQHILPNGLAPIIVASALASAAAILTEASLSFVGLGATPPTPSWGGMLRLGYPFIEQSVWLSIMPGLAIGIATLGLNFLGDGLRDVLDPKLRGR